MDATNQELKLRKYNDKGARNKSINWTIFIKNAANDKLGWGVVVY